MLAASHFLMEVSQTPVGILPVSGYGQEHKVRWQIR